MPKLLLALALTWLPSAFANNLGNYWRCSLATHLQGDAGFFLRHGRDSFNGTGVMRCKSLKSHIQLERTLTVTYNGAQSGYGVNHSSSLIMEIQVITSHYPVDFMFYGYVVNSKRLPEVKWLYESTGTLIEVNVSAGTSAGNNSLQQGNLFIR